MEKPQMISIAGLKARGWTQALITLLGEPDVVTRNSHYAKSAPMRLLGAQTQPRQRRPQIVRDRG
jgi:hypothetical protein